jgi:tRNA(Arg) A34 adenosine deaminase TadA
MARERPAEPGPVHEGRQMQEQDVGHLRRAIALAAAARAAGDMPFGSLLVGPNGEVLAEGRVPLDGYYA